MSLGPTATGSSVLTADVAPTPERVRRAVVATYIAFAGTGVGFASLASRLPQIRDTLHVSPAQLGLMILAIAIGSITAMPLSGIVTSTFGTRRTVTAMCFVYVAGLATIGIGIEHGIPAVVAGFALVGVGNGMWDVAMNVQATGVERALGRSIMSRFHAGFSIGTVAGAAIGAVMIAVGVGVRVHLLAIAALVLAVVPVGVRAFLPDEAQHVETSHDGRSRRFAAWTERRTLLVGLFVLCMAFTEGTGNDWLAISMIDGYHTRAVLGTITFAVFLTSMTVGRWYGPAVIDRYGRVPVLRISAASALVGLLLVVFGSWFPLAVLGAALWGVGAALGFPTGMSAAGDDPRRAAARVSVVASIGYVAFLAGPPLIGFVGDHTGVLDALTIVAGVLAVALLVSGSVAPLEDAAKRSGGDVSKDEQDH